MAKKLAGLPALGMIGGVLKNISQKSRREITRDGALWDEYLHIMDGEARFAGLVLGSTWSQYLVDRSMMAFGLKPVTTGRKLAHARSWHAALADVAEQPFNKLNERLRATMEGFGITVNDWNIMRRSVDDAGFITPSSIMEAQGRIDNLADGKVVPHQGVAEKYAEMISSWTERAVPSGTPNARAFVTGRLERGTFMGEFADAGLQFKSFGLSLTSLQIEAMTRLGAVDSNGRFAVASYFTQLAIGMTLGGAIALQITSLEDGKDLEDMSATNVQFWLRALFKGGGFGLLGDLVGASASRFGGGVAGTLVGPSINFTSDLVSLTVGNAMEAARGEDTKLGREAVNFAGRYTPVASSYWATRGAWRRLFLDQLQWNLDPQAHKSFLQKQRGLKKRTGQEYWWEPGAAKPTRGPVMADSPE